MASQLLSVGQDCSDRMTFEEHLSIRKYILIDKTQNLELVGSLRDVFG